jgi:hypothetical protein
MKIKPRRTILNGYRHAAYLESDRDFMENNRDACIAFLEGTLLTGADIARTHLKVRKGTYRSESEIYQREADLLNKIVRGKS